MKLRIGMVVGMAWLAAGPAAAAGMKLERERQFSIEGPETVGFLKRRFDFQHNFKDYTLNPSVDLTLILGIWDNVQIEGKTLLHNQEAIAFGNSILTQYNAVETTLKWAVLDQSKDDWFSFAAGATIGRVDTKSEFKDPDWETYSLVRNHERTLGGYAVLHYDTTWFTPSAQLMYAEFTPKSTEKKFALTTPGLGIRLKVWEARDARIHLVSDYQLRAFDLPGIHRAWGAGAQMMIGSPHVFSFFVGNTYGDTLPDMVVGINQTFYNFRWSYRF